MFITNLNVHIKLKDSSLYICTFKLIQDLLRHIFFQELTKSPSHDF